jgi:hypothetical protein
VNLGASGIGRIAGQGLVRLLLLALTTAGRRTMSIIKAISGVAVLAAAALGAAPLLAAQTTFATFTPVGAGKNVRFVNDGTGNPNTADGGTSGQLYSTDTATATSKGLTDTRFSFLQGPLSSFITALPAKFELDASVTSTGATVFGTAPDEFYIQTNVNGFFEFTSANAITVYDTLHAAGTVLLRGDFTLASVTGPRGQSNAGFGDGFGGSLVYTSQFLDFSDTTNSDFQMSLNSIASTLFVAGDGTPGDPFKALRSFRATSSGNFSSDPAPYVTGVPEPQVWGLLVVGFGMVGVQVRRRATRESVAA